MNAVERIAPQEGVAQHTPGERTPVNEKTETAGRKQEGYRSYPTGPRLELPDPDLPIVTEARAGERALITASTALPKSKGLAGRAASPS